jgi:hypothetical protein
MGAVTLAVGLTALLVAGGLNFARHAGHPLLPSIPANALATVALIMILVGLVLVRI